MRKNVVSEPEVIKDILDNAGYITLALVDGEGPYSVPVNFVEKDGVIFVHTGKRGRKFEALRAGNSVAFSVVTEAELKKGEHACDYGYKFRSVFGEGASRLLEGDEAREGLDAITLKYAGELLPYKEKAIPATAVFAIDVMTSTARIKE